MNNSKKKEARAPGVQAPRKMSKEELTRALIHDMKTCASLCQFIIQTLTVQDVIVAEMLKIQENQFQKLQLEKEPQLFD